MSLYTTETEWHDLRLDPDDLPGEDEPIIVTVDTFMNRQTWIDVFMKEETIGEPKFYTKVMSDYGKIEDQAIWYPVVAWAYPPPPFEYY